MSVYSDALAYGGTATRRKADRRAVRNTLGTSRDPAPSAFATLRAASFLSSLLFDATGGGYALRVVNSDAETLTFTQATAAVRGALQARGIITD